MPGQEIVAGRLLDFYVQRYGLAEWSDDGF